MITGVRNADDEPVMIQFYFPAYIHLPFSTCILARLLCLAAKCGSGYCCQLVFGTRAGVCCCLEKSEILDLRYSVRVVDS